MTNDEINIVIAEYCGWTKIKEIDYQPFGTDPYIDGPDQMLVGIHPESDSDSDDYEAIPNYCKDLNEMHEAEHEVLTTAQMTTMSQYLHRKLGMLWGFATASQRAEAFVRTIGKWEQ